MVDSTIPRSPVIKLTARLALRDILGITRRNLLRIVRTPQLLFFSIIQPTILLLLFRYVLGGAIKIRLS
jgi:ABC-2 type transport system permease protein